MIKDFLFENHQRGYSFGTYSKPDHNFFRKFLYFLNVSFSIGFSTTWRPDSLVLGFIYSIDVEQFFVRKQKSQCPLCESSFVSNLQVSIFLPFDLQRVLARFFPVGWKFQIIFENSLSACTRYSQITRDFTSQKHS